jgi:hypothetical protein
VAKEAVGDPPTLHVVADAGYSNGEQAKAREAQGIVPHVPANRAVNNQGNGQLFDRSQFQYDEKTDTFRSRTGEPNRKATSGVSERRFLLLVAGRFVTDCMPGPFHLLRGPDLTLRRFCSMPALCNIDHSCTWTLVHY